MLLVILLITTAVPFTAVADVNVPTSIGAPEHFGVGHYYGDSVYFTLSAPEELRTYTENRAEDNPDNHTLTVNFQIDYKIDGGNWHYSADWDSPDTPPENQKGNLYFTFSNGEYYYDSERWSMSSIFPEDDSLVAFKEGGYEYLKSHSITFRARFAETFDDEYVISPWSKEFVFSDNVKADYNKLINNAPVLKSAEIVKQGYEPYFIIDTDRLNGDIQDLNAMSSNSMRTEVWMRNSGDNDFKLVTTEWFAELYNIRASDYFDSSKQSYDEESFEIKLRYALDLREYKQSGYVGNSNSVMIYSPFSNVISHNMPTWSKASDWATPELKKADDTGLIPDILSGADMTKPITREEFAELAVTLYENTTNNSAVAHSPNPFIDTNNPEILKAFKLEITKGTSNTTFEPNVLINREQCAAMLFRALKAISPSEDFSIAGVKDFLDQNYISDWAVESVKYMNKIGIISGDTQGNFMPKATTTVHQAQGYGMATREQAIAMSLRSYEKFK
jgi:hypothetical protein